MRVINAGPSFYQPWMALPQVKVITTVIYWRTNMVVVGPLQTRQWVVKRKLYTFLDMPGVCARQKCMIDI